MSGVGCVIVLQEEEEEAKIKIKKKKKKKKQKKKKKKKTKKKQSKDVTMDLLKAVLRIQTDSVLYSISTHFSCTWPFDLNTIKYCKYATTYD